jgi:hypothetical protein
MFETKKESSSIHMYRRTAASLYLINYYLLLYGSVQTSKASRKRTAVVFFVAWLVLSCLFDSMETEARFWFLLHSGCKLPTWAQWFWLLSHFWRYPPFSVSLGPKSLEITKKCFHFSHPVRIFMDPNLKMVIFR